MYQPTTRVIQYKLFWFSDERARALYSYSAENEDELSLDEGDILTILEKELEDSGWWKGELNGRVGVFPDNFVELLPPEAAVSKIGYFIICIHC